MTGQATRQQLGVLQSMVRALLEDADESTCRTQYHPDLSPLGWHLGHCVYTECYWLHEAVRGDRKLTAPIEDLYIPANTPKPERGEKLPQRKQLLEWAQHIQQLNLQHLANLSDEETGHRLHGDKYLSHFLIQHYCQHFETMIMILHQKTLRDMPAGFTVQNPLSPAPPTRDTQPVQSGHYRIGGQAPLAYDNELPQQRAELSPFHVARRPVSNGEYLAFMEAGGYQCEDYWSDAGRAWHHQHRPGQPEHWTRDENENWYGIGLRGAYELVPEQPVTGISRFEAEAYANWAGGVLPHEYQWETAARLGLLEDVGRAWEWCNNSFRPYDGFTSFPYSDYSQPWFDGKHYTLRGGSLYTQPQIRRHSFRNFYLPDKRHIFAGVRLVFD